MAAFYHVDAAFHDPVFGKLSGGRVKGMWRMLVEKGGGKINVSFHDIQEDGDQVTARWQAEYLFSSTGRMVVNKVSTRFSFEGEKIILHADSFSFWKWAGMALGMPGKLLGWTPLFKNKVRKRSLVMLEKFEQKIKTDEAKQ